MVSEGDFDLRIRKVVRWDVARWRVDGPWHCGMPEMEGRKFVVLKIYKKVLRRSAKVTIPQRQISTPLT